ncbi:MBOAT family O-acyltransferase, partial [uncultured Helicobacter sp.]|uniref:MBOAT family O-acyltransferase n=1 Tax=uncultured Helicobacter sp. TaxID=175537 RepID=UPI00259AC581
SYVVEVYRGESALLNPIDMGLYISFFPQLIAGPIVRFKDVKEYLDKKYREFNFEKMSDGIWRFSVGFCKKVLLANNLGGLAGLVFGVRNISDFSVMYTWLGAVAYTLQIYYDFSGYSDMAIGLGKMFGFEFQENFNYPYFAGTIKEFWRRWHISLSQFFRDYVYIPLGGNRNSTAKYVFNIIVVWFLTGLWHWASWNYIIWGFSYGILLLSERFIIDKLPYNKFILIIRRIATMMLVILLWVVFKCEHLSVLVDYIKNMFGIGGSAFIDSAFIFQVKDIWSAYMYDTPLLFTGGDMWLSSIIAIYFEAESKNKIKTFIDIDPKKNSWVDEKVLQEIKQKGILIVSGSPKELQSYADVFPHLQFVKEIKISSSNILHQKKEQSVFVGIAKDP